MTKRDADTAKPPAPYGWRIERDAATGYWMVYGPDGRPKAAVNTSEEAVSEAERLA